MWESAEGLPQDSIPAIVQTHDGYLWLGTLEGLVRFNGVRFTVFTRRTLPGLPSNRILSLYEDAKDRLWIGTEEGLACREIDGTLNVFSLADGVPAGGINAVTQDPTGRIWIAASQGVFHSETVGSERASFVRTGGAVSASEVVVDSAGVPWAATSSGVLTWDARGERLITKADGLPSNNVFSLCLATGGGVWVGTGNGLARYKDGRVTYVYGTWEGLPHPLVWSLIEDRAGSVWVGTEGGGLARLRDGRFSTLGTADGLTSPAVWSLYEDHEGSLWIGTNGGGLNRLKDGKFITYSRAEGLSDDFIWCVSGGRDGRVWIGTYAGGLNCWKDGEVTVYSTAQGLPDNLVWSTFEDRDGTLWVGSRGGLSHLVGGHFRVYTTGDGMLTNQVKAILRSRSSDLWIGTDRGLQRFRKGRFETLDLGLVDPIVQALFEDREGSLWVGARSGLARIRESGVTLYGVLNGLGAEIVRCIHQDTLGGLWVGTQGGGLSLFDGGRFWTLTELDGLPNDVISQILEDDSHNLWMSSNKGVVRAPISDLRRRLHDKSYAVRWSVFGRADGMKSQECNGTSQPAGFRGIDGRLWFPTIKGVVVIDPKRITVNSEPPPVVIERVDADGLELPLRDGVVVPPGRARFEFHYAGLSYIAPENVLYRYRLLPVDADWVSAGTRQTAYYTQLPPGPYRFDVMACNGDGVWNETGASVPVRVLPLFHQTIWFKLLGVLLAVALAAGLVMLRVRRAVRLERERNLRESEERFRSVTETASDAIIGLDGHGQIFLWNRRAKRIFGYTAEEVSGMDFARLLAEKSRGALRSPADGSTPSTPGQQVEVVGVRKDGTEFPAEISLSVWRSAARIYHTAIIRDITRRKHAEAALQAAARLQAAETLAGGIAHQFNNLMTSVIGNAELLQYQRSINGASLVERLSSIRTAAERASQLASQLLAFAQGGKYQPRLLDLNETVRETMRIQEPTLPPGVVVRTDLDPELPRVRADSGQMTQVIMNLLNNAVEACDGGGTVEMSTSRARVDLASGDLIADLPLGSYVQLSVRDTGCGMTAETIARAFEPFFTTKFTGRGLGLAAVHGIVRNHGGTVKASSEPGRGSTFTVYLPVAG